MVVRLFILKKATLFGDRLWIVHLHKGEHQLFDNNLLRLHVVAVDEAQDINAGGE